MTADDGPGHRLLSDDLEVVAVEDFCRLTGLARAEVDALLRQGLLRGGYGADDRLRAISVVDLPSTGQLRAHGMSPLPGWAEALRSGTVEPDEQDCSDDAVVEGGTWTMGWS
ncbi:hypothetical protein [Nocardioides mesophilus]|uniref:Uncharacterized protein n=1 Tax=Nocardioides mesophilus TaxID=433659 RepID=A0A7G9RAT9_9ACTN|nr:hypothetical protein [Nocardioides mesophilus]QNN52714.1 hypothetical protein H9L09_20115 [Nocardioides mesophilus]